MRLNPNIAKQFQAEPEDPSDFKGFIRIHAMCAGCPLKGNCRRKLGECSKADFPQYKKPDVQPRPEEVEPIFLGKPGRRRTMPRLMALRRRWQRYRETGPWLIDVEAVISILAVLFFVWFFVLIMSPVVGGR